jgi:putative acetyltransferase
MVEIRRIRPEEVPAARELIYRTAHVVFNDQRTLEESIAFYDSKGVLEDLEDIQKNYFDNRGIFLVMTEGGRMIGTGAIRKLEGDLCELKRLWLLHEYHGKRLGYRMMQELLTFARGNGYKRIRLETDPVAQSRAIEFYKRIGFREIPRDASGTDELAMEMEL